MFLDESGDHSLTKVDPQYPLFVLGGVIVDHEYAIGELSERVSRFKRDLFGRDDVILHTAEIVRSRGVYNVMRNASFRERFYNELNLLMRSLHYQVVACVIKKAEYSERLGLEALDPYMLSLNVLVERFCFEIGNVSGGGLILAEQRDPTLDHELELAWLNLRISGTRFMQPATISRRITSLNTRAKEENIAGLQLADLVVSPIGRYVLGKRRYEDWAIIEEKFRRRHGEFHGAGLIVLPRDKE